jgi:hypothetical protein
VSVFRPAVKVRSPDGVEWEIYRYHFKWQRPARRRDLLRAAIAALRSDEWVVDAVAYLPQPRVCRWTTTREHTGQVLAQVEGHLARGDVPQHLAHAVYRGEERRSAR